MTVFAKILLCGVAVFLSGCAGRPIYVEPPPWHPASVFAPAAPLPPVPKIDRDEPTVSADPSELREPSSSQGGGHAHH